MSTVDLGGWLLSVHIESQSWFPEVTDSGTVSTISLIARVAVGISYSWTLGRREERVHRRVVDRLETTSLVLGERGPAARSRQSSRPGRRRWTNRWKKALHAFDITFDGRLTAGRR